MFAMALSILFTVFPRPASALSDAIPNVTAPPTPDPLESYPDGEWPNASDEYYRHYHAYDDDYVYELHPTALPEARKAPCPGTHSFRNMWGDCQCDPSHYYGDPMSERGCWGCNNSCHFEADCIFPGRCQCLQRFKGDGINCEKVVPQILGIAPVQAWSDRTTAINIAYLWDVGETADQHSVAFCKLGTETVQSTLVTNDTIVCIARPRLPQVVDVAIMFEGGPWSTDDFQLLYTNRFDLWGILPIVGLYGIGIAGVGVCIWRIAGGRNEEDAGDESQPFLAVSADSKGAGVAKKKSARRRAGP
jgi:hypothetical protein